MTMTPIYMSPDRQQAEALQTLLNKHSIPSSIIEKAQTAKPGASQARWCELWLKNERDEKRASTIITQHEFETMKSSMSAWFERSSDAAAVSAAISAVKEVIMETKPQQNSDQTPPPSNPIQEFVNRVKEEVIQRKAQQAPMNATPPVNLISVFKRLGKILGLSEEELDLSRLEKLSKPWDGEALKDSVERLKQTCKFPNKINEPV